MDFLKMAVNWAISKCRCTTVISGKIDNVRASKIKIQEKKL